MGRMLEPVYIRMKKNTPLENIRERPGLSCVCVCGVCVCVCASVCSVCVCVCSVCVRVYVCSVCVCVCVCSVCVCVCTCMCVRVSLLCCTGSPYTQIITL